MDQDVQQASMEQQRRLLQSPMSKFGGNNSSLFKTSQIKQQSGPSTVRVSPNFTTLAKAPEVMATTLANNVDGLGDQLGQFVDNLPSALTRGKRLDPDGAREKRKAQRRLGAAPPPTPQVDSRGQQIIDRVP